MPIVVPTNPATTSLSGTYSFTVNRDQIIRQAMLNIGKLDEDESPTASQISDCAFALNMLIKQWMGKSDFAPGLKVWTQKLGYLFLSGTTGVYSVGPSATGWTNSFAYTTTTTTVSGSAIVVKDTTGIASGNNIAVELDSGTLQWTTVSSVVGPTINLASPLASQSSSGAQVFAYATAAQQPLSITTAVLRDQQNTDTPLRILTVQDYDLLPTKTSAQYVSDPTAIYYEFQLGDSNLYTDCGAANDVTKYIVLRYYEPVQDISNAADTFEYPQEWFLALAWGLAKQIAPMFQAQWTPTMQDNYTESVSIARRKEPERVTLFFQPGAEE